MPIVSISLTASLLTRLARFMAERGYSSRSEAIRDAIRGTLADYELSRFESGTVTATITIMSTHERHDLDERLMRLRHTYDDLVVGNMHLHIGGYYCLEIFITKGDAEQVLSFISRIRAMRGIQRVTFSVVPLTGT